MPEQSNAWAPPAVVKEITAPIYVQLAMIIETGTKLLQYQEAHPSEPLRASLGYHDMAIILYDYIPASYIPLGPEPPDPTCNTSWCDLDRPSVDTFKVGREKLMEALNKATPPQVLAEIGDISGASKPEPEGGMNWWVAALGAGGFLSWVGKSPMIARLAALTNRKKLILALAAGLLYALGATGAVTEILPAAKNAAGNLYENLIQKPLQTAGSVLSLALGVGIVGVAGILLYNFAQSQTKKQQTPAIAA